MIQDSWYLVTSKSGIETHTNRSNTFNVIKSLEVKLLLCCGVVLNLVRSVMKYESDKRLLTIPNTAIGILTTVSIS